MLGRERRSIGGGVHVCLGDLSAEKVPLYQKP